jgi:phosphoglycerate dehydrogenase-like enzyme
VTENRLIVSVPGSTLKDAVGAVSNSAVPSSADSGGVEFVIWDMTGPAPVDAIDIVVPPYMGASDKLVNLAGVRTRLVQSQSIGYDGVERVLPPGHVYANAATVHETSTAQLTLALILASQRGIPNFVRAAERGHWAPERLQSLADRTVLIVGYGGVGKAVEQRLLPFETDVVRVASVARDDERGRVHSIDELPDLVPTADIVVIGVPLNEFTTHLVDDRFLSLMPDGALLVNIARGGVVDTDAMLDHATRGRLRFALDVTDPEPLPDGHPLFGLPNVLISPHVGGASTAMMPRMARLLRRQIDRMLAGDEPLNVVLRS